MSSEWKECFFAEEDIQKLDDALREEFGEFWVNPDTKDGKSPDIPLSDVIGRNIVSLPNDCGMCCLYFTTPGGPPVHFEYKKVGYSYIRWGTVPSGYAYSIDCNRPVVPAGNVTGLSLYCREDRRYGPDHPYKLGPHAFSVVYNKITPEIRRVNRRLNKILDSLSTRACKAVDYSRDKEETVLPKGRGYMPFRIGHHARRWCLADPARAFRGYHNMVFLPLTDAELDDVRAQGITPK